MRAEYLAAINLLRDRVRQLEAVVHAEQRQEEQQAEAGVASC